MITNSQFLEVIRQCSREPALFEPGFSLTFSSDGSIRREEIKFWDDEHISIGMLEAHLDPNSDAASRKPWTIEKTVKYLFESEILKPGMRILDLGCGPGLYAQELCRAGARVVGIDISQRSVEYARMAANRAGLDIEYCCMSFFDIDYHDEFDAVLQIYGEICTFSDDMRDLLFKLVYQALKKNGIFIFDVTTRKLRAKKGISNGWYISRGGFWRPGNHLVLEHSFDYSREDVWVDQYIIIDDEGIKVHRNWYHDYSLDTIKPVLESAGFGIKHVWDDLTGSNYTGNGDWIAICAEKK